MIKRTVTYYDFDGNKRTEDLYFNMTKSELIEFSFGLPEDMTDAVKSPDDIDNETAKKLIEKLGNSGIFNFVKDLVVKSYGVKSSDGRRFIKDEQTTREFTQTLAYDEFIMDLFSDDKKASSFINGIIPADMAKQIPAISVQN
jgi:hypothetical protein